VIERKSGLPRPPRTGLGVLGGLAAGAVLMYLGDPEGGRRRRALVRDRLVRAAHRTGDAVDVTSRDVTNARVGSWPSCAGDSGPEG
jgi:hypothetical protein